MGNLDTDQFHMGANQRAENRDAVKVMSGSYLIIKPMLFFVCFLSVSNENLLSI